MKKGNNLALHFKILTSLALGVFMIAVVGCNQNKLAKTNEEIVIVEETDPLPSWNEGLAKTAIFEFVAAVTDKNSADYVKPEERIATFDNDGTLWVEYPMYSQILFAIDRVKELAPKHPEWKSTQPLRLY